MQAVNKNWWAPNPFLRALLGTCIFPLETRSHLYHYTTLDGLISILKEGALWATDVSFMNDTSEYVYADHLITGAITSLESQEPQPADPQLSAARSALFESLREAVKRRDLNVYASCFCECEDLLSQWRAYGTSGTGYALEVEWKHFMDDSTPPASRGVPGKIEYETAKQNELITSILNKQIGSFLSICRREPGPRTWQMLLDLNTAQQRVILSLAPDSEPGSVLLAAEGETSQLAAPAESPEAARRATEQMLEAAKATAQRTAGFLTVARAFLKSRAFSEEREWRVVVGGPGGAAEEFRPSSNGILLPYRRIHLGKTPFPITRIFVGPGLHPNQARNSIERLLQKLNLGHIKVEGSTIPVKI